MKVTFTIKNMTEDFLNKLFNMSGNDCYHLLKKYAIGDLKHNIKMKVGSSDAFRDKVELNSILKSNFGHEINFKIEPRRGYKLATFEIKRT